MSRANVGAMFTSPISAGLMIVCIAALLYPILSPIVKKQFKLGKEYKTK